MIKPGYLPRDSVKYTEVMHHYRKTYKKYQKLNKDVNGTVACSLCDAIDADGIVEDAVSMRVIKNRVPYDMFDGLPTTGEHLLVVPKRHVLLFADFHTEERLEYMEIMAKYEKLGYSVYARSHTNVQRSQAHQHTHLIKLGRHYPKLLLAISKPYLLFWR